jgi:hypothetical protein
MNSTIKENWRVRIMLKLRFVVPLFVIIILAACNGREASPDPGQKNSLVITAAVETARASVYHALTPGMMPSPQSISSSTQVAVTTATGPQYGPVAVVTTSPDFYSVKAAPLLWKTSGAACKADAASLQALSSRAMWSGYLTNDGQLDYITATEKGIAIQSCRMGNMQTVEIRTSSIGQAVNLWGVQDLNQNSVPDVVVSINGTLKPWGDGQAHVSEGMLGADVLILEWNGSVFSRSDLFVPVMTDIMLLDVDANGIVEIIATSSFQPKTDKEFTLYWDAYPWRTTERTYGWTGDKYAVIKIEKGAAEYSSELLADARETANYWAALEAYKQLIYPTLRWVQGLKGWTPKMDAYKVAMAKYYQNGRQGAAPAVPDSSKDAVIADRAWAYYFVILRATAEGDFGLAKDYYSQLQSLYAGVDAAEPVPGIAAAFWNEYSASRDISQACYKARVFTVQQGLSEAASGCFYQEKQPPVLPADPAWPAMRAAGQAPLTVLPSQEEIGALPSIWDVTQITNLDLSAPGVRRFDQALPQNEPLVWPFFWCTGNNPAILQQNLDNLTVFFMIDGGRVPDEYILKYHAQNPSQQCQFWATILRDWQPGSSVQLEIVYHFRTAVFDGSSKYPAGEYRYRLTVHVP